MLALKAAAVLRPKRAARPGRRSSCWRHVCNSATSYPSAKRNLQVIRAVRTMDLDLNCDRSRSGGLDWLRPFSTHGSNRFAVRHCRRGVIFGVLVVVIFRQRSIDKVQNHSGDIDLAAVKELKRFFSQPGRSVGESNDKKRGVDFRRQTR